MKQLLQLIRPFREMRNHVALFLAFFLCAGGLWAQTTDELTNNLIGVTGTSYSNWSGKTHNSNAVYAGNSAGGNSSIQLRSNNNNSGIVTTTSGGKVTKVTVSWNSNTASGRTLNIYGKNTPYSQATDLYNDNQGTLIGTIVNHPDSSNVLTIEGDYSYIGLRSANSAMYLDTIKITWAASSGPITYTVTYDANGGNGTMTDPNSPYEENDVVTLLTNAFIAPEGQMWDSWTVTTNNGPVSVSNNQFVMPASNVTVSAQWVVDPDAVQYEWVLTELSALTSGDVFVIVGNNGSDYAMTNNNGTNAPPVASSVTVVNNKITSPVTDNLRWNISGDANSGYIFYSNSNANVWLYCTNANNGVRVGDNENNLFVLKDGYLYHSATSRYLGVYNSEDWRCYTSINSNIEGQTFAFYKKQEVNDNPYLYADNVEIAYDATDGVASYSIENPVDGGVLSATTTADWLTLGTVVETVPFTCTVNDASTERTATVTLTYIYNTDQTVTANFSITQAANPNITMTIAEVRTQETGNVVTMGTVTSCVGTTGYIQDATAAICVYGTQLNAGDNIRVSGSLATYNGLLEITNPEVTVISSGNTVEPTVKTIAEINADYAGDNSWQGWLVKIEEATVTNINGQNTTIAQGDNTIVVRGISSDVEYAVDDVLTLTGNIGCFNAAQIANPTDVVVQQSVEPSININPVLVEVSAEGVTGTLSVTYENIETELDAEIFWYESDGSTTAVYNWLTANFNAEGNIEYSVQANEGEARTAYFKVFANNVYSDLVTVTQEAPAVPEPPHFTWDLSIASYDEIEDPDIVNWSSDFATMTNSSENGGTSASNYLGGDANNRTSSRFYSGNTLTITPAVGYSITSVEFSATSNNYANALQSSLWTNATATVDGQIVTIVPTDGLVAMSAAIGGTCGFTGVTVYYVEDQTPVIVADDVIIAFDATNGSINYTINNPAESGALAASTTATWITLGDAVDNAVAFTCEANELTEARTATVTLTYTYGDNETVTKDVTISQDANPASAAITIAEVRAQQTGDVLTMGIVTSCVGTTGYIQDATAAICVYGTALTVGDSVLVSGTLSTYKGLLEITNPEVTVLANDKTIEPTVMTIADINSDNAGDNAWQGWLVTIENVKVTAISEQNTTVEQEGATIVVRGISSDVVYAENDMLTLTGNIGCFNVAQIVNPTNVMVQPSLDPSITVTPTTISVDASEHDGMLTVTYENMETVSDVAIVWYESDGETSASSSDWLLAEINGNTIEYLIFANNGEARSAYFKVYSATAGVYSDLVTVTQSAPLITASFTKVSSVSAVQSGKKYILVCPSAVQDELPAPTAATSTVSNSALQAVNVAIGDDGIITTPLNGDGYPCTITFEATGDGYYIQIGEKYLNNTSSTGISLSNNGSSVWVPDLYNGEVILKNSSNNNRFLGGATSEALTYKAYATGNMGSYPVVVLYQEQESVECGPIVFDENNQWEEDFENMTTVTKLFTGVTPKCWTVAHEYTSPSINHIGLEADTLPQLYRSFNHTTDGHYSLRMKYRSLLAMPELSEDVDLSRVRMSLYVRQPQTYYKLQIGVMSDLEDESTFVPVATVNNGSTSMSQFVCDFSGYTGEGRYIAFKNVGGSASDPYCSNYLDDITLTYMEEAGCTIPVPYTENFEGFTTSSGASGVEPDCWEVIREDVALDVTTKPQVYAGFNTTEGGHYSLRMKNRCVYAMPEFAEDVDVKELTLSFSLRQAKSFYRLEVGVVDAAGNFVAVEEINNPGTSIERDVTVDFSTLEGEGTGKRIAFHNILRNSAKYDYSYNYIDDINLYYTSEGPEGSKTMEFAGSDEMNADHYLDNIAVYPNPTTGLLHIDAVDVQKVECYSQMGQLVGVYENVNELNLSELADGVYMLRITVPQGVTMRKVVKR